MRIAFLGTPDFALPSLQRLIDDGHTLMVFTQPDRPKGRHGELTPPPVKTLAAHYGIPVFQCEKIRLPEGVQALRAFAPELMVTAAFGQILSQENLDIPPYGCINVHGSLLPKYRGAAPIQWAVINGERETGVTTMQTDVGLDTGDILLMEKTPIGEEETAGALFERLSYMGASLLADTLAALQAGTLVRVKQDEALASKCGMIKKEQGKIDFTRDAQTIHNLVRGMNPWPSAFALLEGETVKIHRTARTDRRADAKPGVCIAASPQEGLFVATGDGCLEILELQLPGGKRMAARELLRGHSLCGKVFA